MSQILTCETIFLNNKIIPVVVLNDISKAVPIARSLMAGGINIMEVTLRTPNALNIIEKISTEVPEMLVGAGTILTDDDYHKAVKHGSKFIVSPGLTDDLVKVSQTYDVAFIPGVITPTEVITAFKSGFRFLKFFPAESFNGLTTLKSYVSVFSQIKFCPTGGITMENASKYLNLPNVAGIGCSFLITEDSINNNAFDKITQLATQITTLCQHK